MKGFTGDEQVKALRTIALEEHYITPAIMKATGSTDPLLKIIAATNSKLIEQLLDLGEGRIADMDASGTDVQVLSVTSPGVEQLDASEAVELARDSNDYLANAVRRYPDRFIGLATLPTIVPDTAADELERMVSEHGFKGAIINGHTRGRYLDDEYFWPILERAAKLQIPIYIHPAEPPKPVIEASYLGNYPPATAAILARGGWGWHIETGLHVLRVILSGAFDRFPELQIIIGHLGEGLPFMKGRLDFTLPPKITKLDRTVGSYLCENVYYNFANFLFIPTFLDLFLQVGAERIMYSVDYPYSSGMEARSFLEQLPVSPDDKKRIAHGNAERLFRL
ncbi:MAG: amidohydrolase [Dehalobacter sp. 4CP]|uniref:amidohydrolase family protein n=1 Tax=Dehalobacter sp. CP TaxID=2594474 RepID=UPI0013C7581D|nr:amidohydrolase [Dehalobacter sp. 4CP]